MFVNLVVVATLVGNQRSMTAFMAQMCTEVTKSVSFDALI